MGFRPLAAGLETSIQPFNLVDTFGADPTGVVAADSALAAAAKAMYQWPRSYIYAPSGKYKLTSSAAILWPGCRIEGDGLPFTVFDASGGFASSDWIFRPIAPIDNCDYVTLRGFQLLGDGGTTVRGGLKASSCRHIHIEDVEMQSGLLIAGTNLWGARWLDGTLSLGGPNATNLPKATVSGAVTAAATTIACTDATQYQQAVPYATAGIAISTGTTITQTITKYTNSVTVASAAPFSATGGFVYIDKELIYYSAVQGLTLTGLWRSWDSQAATHTSGTTVYSVELFSYTGRTRTSFTGCTRGINGSVASAYVGGEYIQQNPGDITHPRLDSVRTIGGQKVGLWATGTLGGGVTTCNGATGTGTGAITVAATADFPTNGSVLIEDEEIAYTGKSATQLGTGTVTRNVNGTGNVNHATLTPVYSATTANGAVLATGDITVRSTTGFASTNGVVMIDEEAVFYTGPTTGTSFVGCSRGWRDTTAATHLDKARVLQNVRSNGGTCNQYEGTKVRAGGTTDSPTVAAIWVEQGAANDLSGSLPAAATGDAIRLDWYSNMNVCPTIGPPGVAYYGVNFGTLDDWTGVNRTHDAFVLGGHVDLSGGAFAGFMNDPNDQNNWWSYRTGLHLGLIPATGNNVTNDSFWRNRDGNKGVLFWKTHEGIVHPVVPRALALETLADPGGGGGTWNPDSRYNGGLAAALSGAITIGPFGNVTYVQDEQLYELILISAASKAMTWDTTIHGNLTLALPAATTGGGKMDRFVLQYQAAAVVWDLVGLVLGA